MGVSLAEENIQESLFLALDETAVDLARHFPVKTLFSTVEYRKATADLSDELLVRIDQLQDKFKSYLVPSVTFETLQENIVDHGFEELCKDRDLQLRVCAGVITRKATPKSILDLRGDEVEKGILGALDSLKREVDIQHYKLISHFLDYWFP